MRTSAFAFYRGTCHLFYEDWPARSPLNRAPLAWVSGDLHPENFGSYRARDGNVYFDVNDFDEAVLGLCVWDTTRCLTGIAVGAAEVGVLAEDIDSLARRYLYAYCANLGGEPGVVDSDVSHGMVHDLLERVRVRRRAELVARRTVGKKKKRRILIDDAHAVKLDDTERRRAEKVFDGWNASRKKRIRFELLDVAERLAGTGSMGVPRYVALASRGVEDFLFDIKVEATPSSAPFLRAEQPEWECDAERVVRVQQRAQAVPPSPLGVVFDKKRSYVVKELEPTEDRVQWESWRGKLDRLEHLASSLGQVTAWSHLRGAGRKGAATGKALAAFGVERGWPAEAMERARSYAVQVRADYEAFCGAYDAGRLRHA